MPELTGELVVDGKVPGAPALSPNGRWVVYPVRADRISTLWIAAVDGSEPPRPLTAGSVPRWAPDSTSIFFLSDEETAQLHKIPLTGGPAETLTSWPGGIADHLPLADPGLVAVAAPDEPPADGPRVWGEHFRPSRLRLLELRTGTLRTFGDRHVVEMTQRPDGGPLAILTWRWLG